MLTSRHSGYNKKLKKVRFLIVYFTLFLGITGIRTFKNRTCSIPVWPLIKTPALLAANSPQGSTVPLISKYMAFQLGEQLTGQPLKSVQHLNSGCIKAKFKGLAGSITGFGREIVYSCSPKGHGAAQCESTSAIKTSHKGDGRWIVGWTDNKNHVLIIRCLQASDIKDWTLLSKDVKLSLKTNKKGWAVPLMIKYMAFQLGEQLTGQPLNSVQQLHSGVTRAKFKGLAGSITGFGKEIVYSCYSKGRGAAQCESTSAIKTSHKGDGRWIVGWTDNKNHVLIIRCLQASDIKDWTLLSKDVKLSLKTNKKVLKYLDKLGFSTIDDAVEINYDKC